MKKRILSLVLSFLIILSSFTAFAGESTKSSDIEGRWSFSIINKWVEKGSLELNQDGSFQPTMKQTAAQFKDLIKVALDIDITVTDSGKYITRSEAAILLAKALELDIKPISVTQFTDDVKISSDAKAAIIALMNKGIFSGYPDGSFRPENILTREEIVALIDQISNKDLSYTKGVLQTTIYGQVEGLLVNEDKSIEWLGVPYAKPPVNELRWKAPQAPSSWEGVLETKTFPSIPLQLSGANIVGSEDCLYLNVFRPNTDATNLPVLVFIHGGNNQTGSTQSFKGEVLAANTNSIVIAVEYRLGALGWLNMPAIKTGNPLEDSGNFGLLDIHEALTWVNENVKAFGGNPNNITLSGQSAGGRDVMAMLISPIFAGDFQKAYAISGGMTVSDPEVGQEVATAAIATLVVDDEKKATIEDAITWLNTGTQEVENYLQSLEGTRLAKLMTNAAIRMSVFPHLFADGYVLPSEGFDVFETGEYNKVPTMLGSCNTEFSLFAATDPLFVGAFFGGTLGTNETLLPQFQFANKYGSLLYTGFNADRSAEKMVEVTGQPDVYAYRFTWGEDDSIITPGWGILMDAFHGIDMDFITGREDSFVKTNYTADNKPGRQALQDVLQGYIKNFLYTGNPNGDGLVEWNEWSGTVGGPKLMTLNADKEKVIVSMTNDYIVESEVFAEMDADTTLSAEEKELMISTVMSGRFFSANFDAIYNK